MADNVAATILRRDDDLREKVRAINLSKGVVALLIISTLMLISWSFAIPIFDAPDEIHHWQYAHYLNKNWQLPFYDQNFVEANSPPLYYLLIAPFATSTNTPPRLAWGDSQGIHVPFPPRFYQNADGDFTRYWPIRTARLVTVLMSVVTVFFCYLTGVEVTGRTGVGLLCAGLTAFLPQFTFRGSNISNDALVTTMCAIALYLIIRLIKRGFTWPLGVATAVVIAGAFLSKTSAMFLPAPVALALLFQTNSSWRTRILRTLSVLGLALIIVTPWMIRNQILYGDPLAQKVMLTAVSMLVDKKPLSSPYFWTNFPAALSRSFVGVFGYMNLWLPGWIYSLFGLLFLVSALGYLWRLFNRRISISITLVLISIFVLNLIVVIVINITFSQPQGRYMFPSLPAISLFVALGLDAILGRLKYASTALITGLAVLNVYILLGIVVPSYWPPAIRQLSLQLTHLEPSTTHNVSLQNNSLIILNEDPQVVIKTDLDTAQYNFLQFDISGMSSGKVVDGAVYFALDGNNLVEKQVIPFKWVANGKPQHVIVPLSKHPAWHGRLTMLRVDPVNFGDVKQYIGMPFRIENIVIRGSLESQSFD
jgi:4-amino-4-deoxy-L-arabinose transferase-like glycosyltransferase